MLRRRPNVLVAVLLLLVAALVASACGRGSGDSGDPPAPMPAGPTSPAPTGKSARADAAASLPTATPSVPPAPHDLPRGGRTVLPNNRVVAFYGEGYPGGMGLIEVNDLDGVAARLQKQADGYAGFGRPVLPAMELIATNAVRKPGPDGSYSLKLDDATIDRYLAAARKHRMLLVLDFQPGTDEFLPQVKRYEKYLTQPDVAIGLDPEWRTPGSRPYAGTGHSSAAEINAVGSYVAGLVRANRLPQKLFVVHQFTAAMVPDRQDVKVPEELAVVFHMDGIGPPGLKESVYNRLSVSSPYRNGFKVFPVLDKPAMTPQQVMQLRPRPEVITYQ